MKEGKINIPNTNFGLNSDSSPKTDKIKDKSNTINIKSKIIDNKNSQQMGKPKSNLKDNKTQEKMGHTKNQFEDIKKTKMNYEGTKNNFMNDLNNSNPNINNNKQLDKRGSFPNNSEKSYTYSDGEEKKIKGIFGFKNNKIFNNCFMNSSLQNLFCCKEFTKLIHSVKDEDLKPLSKEIKQLIDQINKGETLLDPTNIKDILSEEEEKYKYNQQSDANEFITIFLNRLLKELNGKGEYNQPKIPADIL